MSVPWFAQGKACGKCKREFTAEPASLSTGREGLRCYLCLLDLREQQLADCTRAMREVSAVLRSWGSGETWCCLADKLDAARAGKAGA